MDSTASPPSAFAAGLMDASYVCGAAILTTGECPRDGRAVVIDGSMLSPSWRALPHGRVVYENDLDAEAYTESLDRTLDNWTSERGYTVGWEDGMLFVYGPDYEAAI